MMVGGWLFWGRGLCGVFFVRACWGFLWLFGFGLLLLIVGFVFVFLFVGVCFGGFFLHWLVSCFGVWFFFYIGDNVLYSHQLETTSSINKSIV